LGQKGTIQTARRASATPTSWVERNLTRLSENALRSACAEKTRLISGFASALHGRVRRRKDGNADSNYIGMLAQNRKGSSTRIRARARTYRGCASIGVTANGWGDSGNDADRISPSRSVLPL